LQKLFCLIGTTHDFHYNQFIHYSVCKMNFLLPELYYSTLSIHQQCCCN